MPIFSKDGMENLKLSGSGLGQVYQDFQRFVLSLYYHGVILAVCSKNDLTDVLRMFHEHSEMLLKEEHIACFQVNWEDKPGNIQKIAEKLKDVYKRQPKKVVANNEMLRGAVSRH